MFVGGGTEGGCKGTWAEKPNKANGNLIWASLSRPEVYRKLCKLGVFYLKIKTLDRLFESTKR